ncbi:MAG: NAD-glutamate dehydrogenase [Henriciella sp.]|nr:NAD-glutamate dehydrogenase [Henriciella sp.]
MAEFSSVSTKENENYSKSDFLEQIISDSRHEAAISLSDDALKQFAEQLWDWSEQIAPEETGLRLRHEEDLGFDCLETVGPDRPFLVDSLLGACSDLGIAVKALLHPIVDLGDQTQRSVIQIFIEPIAEHEREALLNEARLTLEDVGLATSDYFAMRQRMADEVERLRHCPFIDPSSKSEAIQFLSWLGTERFVFLGARQYTFQTDTDGTLLQEEPDMVEGSNLGLLRDERRNVLNRGAEPLVLDSRIGEFLAEPQPLILAKSTLLSRVHRRVPCDYVGVKHYDERGRVVGETRFLGLYTSEAYHDTVSSIPLIKSRMAKVLKQLGAVRGSHNEKALTNIIEGWPRDEIYQTDAETLAPMMQGALGLVGRPQVRLFVRPDEFNRFVSAIVFIPRDAYDTELRQKITDKLEAAFGGKMIKFEPSFDVSTMVRVIIQLSLPTQGPWPDVSALEAELAVLSRTWRQDFRTAITCNTDESLDPVTASLFSDGFNAAYREAFTPQEALTDITMLSKVTADEPVKLRAFRNLGDDESKIRAKIYSRTGSIPLSQCVPVFENMGLFVAFENGFPISPSEDPVEGAPDVYWVHSLSMRRTGDTPISLETVSEDFEQAFEAIWSGQAENDGFNALVLAANLTWREAALCRALCAYRHQSGRDPTRKVQVEALVQNPEMTRSLIKTFHARFDPAFGANNTGRTAGLITLKALLEEQLKAVRSLDHDRVIRRLVDLIFAIQRTNFYQHEAAPYIAFKIASEELADLPEPKPFREIFVSGPTVEGVHCRFGPVARGGLRWSDRRDDFRTEVLGLVKAQQVKNAVIVPAGSKGGFFPKQLPTSGSREAIREAGIVAYKQFISGLLDLTDNLKDGQTIAPADTMVWDGEDPYLVVAADKGTATFSDIANEISLERGFWLGDAFASGGSAGYDHKKMGITARGAWEAVKRHFRELGKDIQSEPFTVIGCGDMSGDVFGNGMLLSKQIKLQAAFNHLHIFIDPAPGDPERMWEERKRLFDLPQSSWSDYDQSLISAGGGIFDRADKAIPLSPEIRAMTGLTAESVTPDELIHALLKTKSELLWFGGIGTYVKASIETHAEADDRGNDGVRVDATEVGARVVGEGANLGLTQAARIEFAKQGGRVNTDAIDNSAGVDSSDHEVNIKILCAGAIESGTLDPEQRDALLASMTDEVALKVLTHNYDQTGALSRAASLAEREHNAYERLMVWLEARGVLDRSVEGLPSTQEMQTRQLDGVPLTRPEIAVLMAWTKIVLFEDLVASDLPDDPYFQADLETYFPAPLAAYQDAMNAHALKREIIATVLANRFINVRGPLMLLHLTEETHATGPELVAALEIAGALLGRERLSAQLKALDNQVEAQAQMAIELDLSVSLMALTRTLLERPPEDSIAATIGELGSEVETVRRDLPDVLSDTEAVRYHNLIESLAKPGVPDDLLTDVAKSSWMIQLPRLVTLAQSTRLDITSVFSAYQRVGEAIQVSPVRQAAWAALPGMARWDMLATRRLLRALDRTHVEATALALSTGSPEVWLQNQDGQVTILSREIKAFTSPPSTFAQLVLAADAIRSFVDSVEFARKNP